MVIKHGQDCSCVSCPYLKPFHFMRYADACCVLWDVKPEILDSPYCVEELETAEEGMCFPTVVSTTCGFR